MSLFKKNNNEDLLEEENKNLFTYTKINIENPTTLKPEEILSGFSSKPSKTNHNALESLKQKVEKTEPKSEPKPEPESKLEPQNDSLFQKCQPFLTDEGGSQALYDEEPIYKLQSVAEILHSESNKAIEELSKKYDLMFENFESKPTKTAPEKEEKEEKTEEENVDVPTSKITNIQSNIPSIISDLEATPTFPVAEPKDISNTATITFTPVTTSNEKKTISVSTKTQSIDLTGEIVNLPENIKSEEQVDISLEKNEFDEYIPENELSSPQDLPKLRRTFAIKNRNAFLSSAVSAVFTLALSFLALPFMDSFFYSSAGTAMTVSTIFLTLIVFANISMFSSLKNFLRKKGSPDIITALASVLTIATSISAIVKSEDFLNLQILMAIILTTRAVSSFQRYQTHLANLRVYASPYKKAVKLIGDSAITSAMAKNAVEGDTLIAASQDTEFVEDYIKYSSFSKFLGGKLPVITVASIILSAILSFSAFAYFKNLTVAFYTAAAVFAITSIPSIYFIDTLPLFRASKKLKKVGAAIAGKSGAEQLEMANAVVLTSRDFFPDGTVTLHDMKILSQNNLEDTIIRASALTEHLGSTLASLFKTIAKSADIVEMPSVDTVKYEDRLGISGWVDNRLLFIGNRTLMETHGIEVPSIEVDYDILRNGYFPIYLATREKACALLVVQYNVNQNNARELHKLTKSGVTLLVNNSDPNLTEEMLCDYFGLYKDTVKVMTAAGCYIHKNATVPIKKISSPAVCRQNRFCLPYILNCAAKVKSSNSLLSTLYVLFSCFGVLLFAYSSFTSSGEVFSSFSLLLYSLIASAFTYIIYLIERP